MKVYTHEVDQREVILDMNLRLVRQNPHFTTGSVLSVTALTLVDAVPHDVNPRLRLMRTVHFAVMKVTWTLTRR